MASSMEFQHWSKTHRRVRYELTASGVRFAQPAEIEAAQSPAALEVRGTYGDPELIACIAARYRVNPECVLPVPGTSSANFVAMAACLRHGDSIGIETPTYDPLVRVASFLGLAMDRLARRPEEGFGIRLAEVENALRRGAKAVVLTNLHNPAGRLIHADDMAAIAATAGRYGAYVIVDEVYLDGASLVSGSPLWTAATLGDNVVVTNSLTKVYGLGGLRVGWALANPGVTEQARRVTNLLSVDNPAPSTALALRAFSRLSQLEQRYLRAYAEGQPIFRRWLATEARVHGYPSHGALFECVRLPHGVDAHNLNELLVTKFETQVVPGSFFELPDHIRVAIGVSPEVLAEGLARLSLALAEGR